MVVSYLDPREKQSSIELAQHLGLSFVEPPPKEDYFLSQKENRIVVYNLKWGKYFSIDLDWEKRLTLLRQQKFSFKKDLLSRAVGYKGQKSYRVFDGTLGLGKDALHLWFLGCQIVGSEIDPVVFALVQRACELFKVNFKLFQGDTLDTLKDYKGYVDCLYLDPLFETVKMKSAPQKGMAFLRSRQYLASSVSDIFPRAQDLKIPRWVLKRPLGGEPLFPGVSFSLSGKMVVYDVYFNKKFKG